MFETLPATAQEFGAWTWAQIAPFYDDLVARPLTADSVAQWLGDWTKIAALIDEVSTRFMIATTVNTADEESERRYKIFLDEIVPQAMAAEQKVKQKLIESGLQPRGFELPLKKLKTEADLYHESNLPLLSELRKLSLEYDKISGARIVQWDGAEIPMTQLSPILQDPDRERRERAWRTMIGRIRQDSDALAPLWQQLLMTRRQVAQNAGFDNFRAYRWQQLFRFDYTPADAKQFLTTIEKVVVPAARRSKEKRRQRLGIPTLRPWDLTVDPTGLPALHPCDSIAELETKTLNIFRHIDPQLASYFETMQAEKLLDLDSRKNKASGGYSLGLSVTRRPFIFANAVGNHGDVVVLLHEGGHAFHTFEVAGLPYLQQRQEQMVPIEFAEVASTAMELLGLPYLTTQYGGFYNEAQAARAAIEALEGAIIFWPYMAMIDALQHKIYENELAAADIQYCDAVWTELVDRYGPGIDWSGLDAEKRIFWRQQSHVFQSPFYYIEYGIALLGAVQVWANSLRDPAEAVAAYRRALALGGTAALPELYAKAGAKFAFDAETLQSAVDLLEQTITQLEPIAYP